VDTPVTTTDDLSFITRPPVFASVFGLSFALADSFVGFFAEKIPLAKRQPIQTILLWEFARRFPLLPLPQSLKAKRSGPGIDLGVRNIAMAQVVLNQPRIAPFIGQGKSTTVPEHMRMVRLDPTRKLGCA
jgi:hypothetical protein